MSKILPVIMSGGAGSRLWPLSRKSKPKQFLDLVTDKSMIQETVERFEDDDFLAPVFICNELHVPIIQQQMDEMGQETGGIIVEPVGRNTAPCAVVAAAYAKAVDETALVLLIPADQHVKRPKDLVECIRRAVPAATNGQFVTFGIEPDGPETGYGYIEHAEKLYEGAYKVNAFKEKPNKDTAKAYLESGGYTWNAGIFLFTPQTLFSAAHSYAEKIHNQSIKSFEKADRQGNIYRLDKTEFEDCPSESIDYAIMEYANNIAVVPCDVGWNDIGSFTTLQSVRAEYDKDEFGNSLKGNVTTINTHNSLVQTDGMPVSIIGLSNIGVILNAGELIVINLDESQDVKKIVNRLKETNDLERL